MASYGAAAPVGRRRNLVTALVCGLLAIAIGGCAELPASGKPQALAGNSGQAPGFVEPLPPPGPAVNWSPVDVIAGFLHASASLALDPGAAKLYLAPGVKWQPLAPNTVVIVVGEISSPSPVGPPVGHPPTGATHEQSYDVTGPRLATLTSSGQYINSPGATGTYQFTLAQYHGVYRIQSIQQISPKSSVRPDSLLLLDQADFQQVFQPHNLYFFSQPSSADLVPDPVFAPIQGSTVNLAKGLVTGLISGAGNAGTAGWLSGATTTAFPAATDVLGVTLGSDLTATVNLGGAAATMPRDQQQMMYEQISKTLTSPPAVAASLQLEFNGQPFQAGSQTFTVPKVGTGREPFYFADNGNGRIYVQAAGHAPAEVAGPSQFSAGEGITAIAAARPQQGVTSQLAVATSTGQGCSIAIGTPSHGSRKYRTLVLSPRGGPCTTLSWDGNGDLWAAAGSLIWVVRPGRQPQPVSLPDGIAGSSPSVLALKVAPDSTRVALLVHTTAGNSLYLEAVTYGASPGAGVSFGPPDPIDPIGPGGASQLGDPTALSWHTANTLAVIDGSANSPELFDVPLTGGEAQEVGSMPPGTNAISSNGTAITLGTSAGRIYSVSFQTGSYQPINHGSWPAYPG